MSLDLRPLPVLALTTAVLLVALTLGVLGPPPVPGARRGPDVEDEADAGARATPTAGGTVCVTGASAVAPTSDVVLVAPADEEDIDTAAVVRARGIVLGLQGPEGAAARRAVGPVGPGSLTRLPVEAGADGWSWVGWADHPLLAWQEWRTDGGPGEPRGAVASACRPTDPPEQTVVGLRTTGGERALLRLANPYLADATFAVTLFTPTGPVEPIQLRNVSVPSGERITLLLNDHVPEQADLAAVVTVGAGRLAVEGLQTAVAELGGVEGVAAAAPLAAPEVAWTLPWLPTADEAEGAVWILNPAPRPVTVELTVHTSAGPTVPEDVGSVEVGARALRRLDAVDLAVDGQDAVGVTVRSTTTGVVVAGGARFRSEETARTGLVHVAASPAPDGRWAVAGVTALGRTTVLHVVNRASSAVTPQVRLTTLLADADGVAADGGAGETRLDGPTIGPGAVGRIVLPLEGSATWSAVVEGGPGLVVARTSVGEDALEPVVLAATPAGDWGAATPVDGGRRRDGWVATLGTRAAGRPPTAALLPDGAEVGLPGLPGVVEAPDAP